MVPCPGVRRVVLLVLDGLRADAVEKLELTTLRTLALNGAATFAAQTVRPSVTAAAMTSLISGVPPSVHGVASDRFAVPRNLGRLRPLPRLLKHRSLPSAAFFGAIPARYHWLAGTLGRLAGVRETRFGGDSAAQILDLARESLSRQRDGLILIHWPDADRAGHLRGWMSPPYVAAARAMDAELDRLLARLDLARDPSTLLIICSDHGGGGVRPDDHDSEHPDDRTIPVVLAGGATVPTLLPPGISLLYLPPTILWALGLKIPSSYSGRVLVEAFGREAAAA